MSTIRSNKAQHYYPTLRSLAQLFRNCMNYKRHICLIILFLFIIPTIFLLSHSPIEPTNTGDTEICSKLVDIIYNSNRTLCSKQADLRGNKQKIISLSIFGPKENPIFIDSKFSHFMLPLINEAQLLFPKWTIRLYSDELTINRLNLQNFSRLSTNIDICNVNQLPILGNVGEYLAGRLWRFIPALDPMVDFTSSRDIDSPLTEREQIVIEQFINSSYLFLVMRDGPWHKKPILAGLWTSSQYRNRLLFLRLFSILLDRNKVKKYSLAEDETLLGELIWPTVKNQTLVFDSYLCQQFPEGNLRPYPTQRSSTDCHLGCIRPCCGENLSKIVLQEPCPQQCRPKNHTDWIYC